ncbi:tetratricopeptide repeat protein [Nocardia salmonicida]|uniref:tetratricopeptide repeat protein n=1 Tax=Nocardia salmonicida TaxID=53431 RepID=UPI00340EF017
MSELHVYLVRGIEALQADVPVAAIIEFEAAISTADTEFELADCYYWLATAQYENGDLDTSTITLESALDLIADTDATELRGRCHESLADLAMEREDATGAHHHFSTARALLSDIDPETAAHCLLGMATADLGVEEFTRAETQLQLALQEFDAIDDTGGIAASLDMLAALLTELGRDPEAITHLARLAGILTEHSDYARAADANRRLGNLLLPALRIEEGLRVLESAKTDFLRADEPLEAAEIALKIGMVMDDLGRFAEAAANYREGGVLCATHGDPDDALWYDVNLATIAMNTGDYLTAEANLTKAADRYRNSGTDVGTARYAQTLRFLGALRTEQSRFQLAVEHYEEAFEIGAYVEDEEFISDCHYGLGLIDTLTGRYRTGLERLSLARETFSRMGSDQKEMLCHHSEGICWYSLGEYSDATDSLFAARRVATTYGMDLQRAITDMHLGLVFTETGRFADAEQALRGARAIMIAAELPDRVMAADSNIAGLYLKQGRYADAAEIYRRSADELRTRELHSQAAVCTQNEGMALIMIGELDASAAAFDQAGRHFAADPDHRANLALVHRGRGLLATMRHDHDTALAEFAAGRVIATEIGTLIEVAKGDFFVAVTLYDQDKSAVATAIDLALPAVLYINSIRLQFDSATDRVSWSALYTQLQAHLFTLAVRHPDPTLLGDLIEVSLNSGTHTTATSKDLLRTTSLAAAKMDISGPPHPSGAARIHGGAAILVAGTALPMAPPPRLRMPDGRLALEPYFAAAAQRYGLTDPASEVRTW